MTSPNDDSPERVDLHKPTAPEPDAPLDFDPYRFGAPEQPVPPEYAPPGYVPPQPEQSFDPYRFGAPEQPVPPEYAPPGYVAPPPPGQYSPYGPGSPYGPPPYGSGPQHHPGGPHGAWPPNPHGQYPNPYGQQPNNRNQGKAVAALVLGIGSIVFCWLTLFDAVLIVPAIIFAARVIADRGSASRRMAIAGLICAIVGAVAAVALLIWLAPIAKECSGVSSDQQQSCIRDHL